MEELDDLYKGLECKVGEKVKGKVISVDHNRAVVDINKFTEGEIYLDHYTLDKNVSALNELLAVGDEIEAEVTKVDAENGVILLSRIPVLRKEESDEFAQKAKEETMDVVATVKRKLAKSYQLEYKGFKLFMPLKDVKEELKNGSKIEVRIVEIDTERGTALASHYLVEKDKREREHQQYLLKREEEKKALEAKRLSVLETINVGDVLEAEVLNIVPYGVFVKLKDIQGLIRLKELDHKFVKDPTEVISIGEKINVKVLSKDNGKLELSRKATIPSPYQIFKETHHKGDTIKVKAIQKMPFGILCELADDLKALLHKSEFSWNPNDNLMASVLIGDELEVAILDMNDETEKVSLSKKALIDNPWSRVNANVGDVVDCKVLEIEPKGIKVEALGVDGFIPANRVVLDGNSSKMSDYYAKDDEIKAKIIKQLFYRI